MRWAEGHARNTLGFSLAMTGEVDEGAEQLREAIRIARERDDLPDLGDAYVNYSDMLHILGRSDEARAIALEGREAVGDRRPIAIMWLDCQLAEFAYDVGDWESRGAAPARPAALDGHAHAREPQPAQGAPARRARARTRRRRRS